MTRTPVLVVGAGAMGGALIKGWLAARALAPADLLVVDPSPGHEALAAEAAGSRLNPPLEALSEAAWVLLAVKPQYWRSAAERIAPHLAPNARIVSIAAGVSSSDLAAAFGGRRVARAMPTLASAIGAGSTAVWSADAEFADAVAELFAAVGAVARLPDEDALHGATAASGSGPAYFYAFIEALEAAAVAAGVPAEQAPTMIRATVCGSAAMLALGDDPPAELRRRVTSPGGTTAAALAVLLGEGGLGPLMQRAVAAAAARSRELGR